MRRKPSGWAAAASFGGLFLITLGAFDVERGLGLMVLGVFALVMLELLES